MSQFKKQFEIKGENYRSPLRIGVVFVFVIFILEFFLNLIIAFIHPLPSLYTAIIDSVMLVLLLVPGIYFLVYKPMARSFDEQRKGEERLKFEKYLLAMLMDNLPDQIYFKDRESRFIRISKMMLQRFGFKEQSDAIGKTDFDVFETEYAQQTYEDERQIIATGQPIIHFEEKETWPDGSVTWVLTTKIPLFESEGNIIGTFGLSQDITQSKLAETEQQVMSEITRGVTTTDNLDELLSLIHSSLRKIIYAENCFFALYDDHTGLFSFPYYIDQYDTTPAPEAIPRSCTAYVFRSGKSLLLTPEVFQKLRELNEVDLVGTVSPSWIGIILQTSSRKTGVLVLQNYEKENVYTADNLKFLDSIGSQVANVIERKRAEEALKKNEVRLHDLNATKDKFFSIIAHDLKSPFNSIIGFSDLLMEQIQSKDYEGIEQYARIIQNSSQHAMDLLMNLMEWARSQTGRIDFAPVSVEIGAIIDEVIRMVNNIAQQKSISISGDNVHRDNFIVDKNMITTVLRNLVLNAVKFTHLGGKIVVSTREKADEWMISVSDTGVGMKKEKLEKLFRIDKNTSSPGTQNESGTGLGLLICKEFVEIHNGRIWVESEEGKGSTFSFAIPKKVINSGIS